MIEEAIGQSREKERTVQEIQTALLQSPERSHQVAAVDA